MKELLQSWVATRQRNYTRLYFTTTNNDIITESQTVCTGRGRPYPWCNSSTLGLVIRFPGRLPTGPAAMLHKQTAAALVPLQEAKREEKPVDFSNHTLTLAHFICEHPSA